MELRLIYNGQATLEDLYELYEKKGYEFVIADGKVAAVKGVIRGKE